MAAPTTASRDRTQVLGSWTTAQPVNGVLTKGDLATSHAALVDWAYHGPSWDEYLDAEDVGHAFRADNGFFGQNGYRRLYSETTRKFLGVPGFNEIAPYFFADYKTAPDGSTQYQQTNLGLRLGLARATTIWLEYRPNNLTAVRPGGGLRKRDQVYFGLESNPLPWVARFFTEVAYGDRLDVANNRIGKGAYFSIQANLRPHPRAEVEYRIDNDFIDSLESVEGSSRIITQRAQQLLAIWHFTARDSLRAIWQSQSVRRAPSLFEQPVPARENTETFSLVYGHYRAIGTTFYLGATASRTRVPDAGVHHDQLEVFAKGSWRFDIL
jgi:hypothetical protein